MRTITYGLSKSTLRRANPDPLEAVLHIAQHLKGWGGLPRPYIYCSVLAFAAGSRERWDVEKGAAGKTGC